MIQIEIYDINEYLQCYEPHGYTFVLSVIPHGITNLTKTWYADYKIWKQSEEVALMSFHPEYFTILFELNISTEFQDEIFIEYRNRLLSIIDDSPELAWIIPTVQSVSTPRDLNRIIRQLLTINIGALRKDIKTLQQDMYETVMYIDNDRKNERKYL